MSKCRSCKAEIIWVRLNGKNHPVDAKRVPGGNLKLIPSTVNGSPDAEIVKPDKGRAMWRSHFASCPQAAMYREHHAGSIGLPL